MVINAINKDLLFCDINLIRQRQANIVKAQENLIKAMENMAQVEADQRNFIQNEIHARERLICKFKEDCVEGCDELVQKKEDEIEELEAMLKALIEWN